MKFQEGSPFKPENYFVSEPLVDWCVTRRYLRLNQNVRNKNPTTIKQNQRKVDRRICGIVASSFVAVAERVFQQHLLYLVGCEFTASFRLDLVSNNNIAMGSRENHTFVNQSPRAIPSRVEIDSHGIAESIGSNRKEF